MKEKIELFKCKDCGYEDSSFIPISKRDGDLVDCPNCNVNQTVSLINSSIGKDMSLKEYIELLKFIDENHSFLKLKGKMIKYVSNIFDFRTMSIGKITLDDKVFSKTNENRHRNLKDWVYGYLNS